MKKATLFLIILGVATLIGWFAALPGLPKGDEPPSMRTKVKGGLVSEPRVESGQPGQMGGNLVKSEVQDKAHAEASKEAFIAALAGKPIKDLLALFELTGDMRYFEAAKKYHGDDSYFLTAAGLTAKAPNSPALKALEAAQPDNALPNILRAGMYASKKDWKGMKEEMEQAASKKELTMNTRERKAALLDLLIEDPNLPTSKALMTETDFGFFRQLEAINRALDRNPNIFGGAAETASAGIGLALRLKNMDENNFSTMLVGNGLEIDLLSHVDKSFVYGDTDITVGQRLEQLGAAGVTTKRLGNLYQELYKPITDANTQRQFFARVRSDGEIAALQWFGEKIGANAIGKRP